MLSMVQNEGKQNRKWQMARDREAAEENEASCSDLVNVKTL